MLTMGQTTKKCQIDNEMITGEQIGARFNFALFELFFFCR
jgi:hypothetical protein